MIWFDFSISKPQCWLAMLVLLMLGRVDAAEKIKWRTDYNSARKEAKEKGLPLFLDIGTEDCFHCRRLDSSTFRDEAIIKLLNEQFIPLKVDANREPALIRELRIQAYPTMIMASTDGKIVALIEGYLEANRLSEHMVRAVSTATPDWMARDFQEAAKAINQTDYARAVSLLRSILEDGKDRPVQAKARQVMQEVEQQALGRLSRVKMMQDKGQSLEAIDILTDLLKRYAGTTAANDGAKLLSQLADSSEIHTLRKNRRSLELIALAKEEFKAERYLNCLEYCETLQSAYSDTAAAKEGLALADEIRNHPEKMTRVCDSMNDRMAEMYMVVAESWMKKGNSTKATEYYEKIVKQCSGSKHAEAAQMSLVKIQTKSITTPVQFTKP